MTRKKKPSLARANHDDEVTELIDAEEAAREEATRRARACAEEVAGVLNRHRCRIMPRIDPTTIEPVGLAGDRIQIAATYWIAPLPEE